MQPEPSILYSDLSKEKNKQNIDNADWEHLDVAKNFNLLPVLIIVFIFIVKDTCEIITSA